MFKDAQCRDISNAEWIADRLVNIFLVAQLFKVKAKVELS